MTEEAKIQGKLRKELKENKAIESIEKDVIMTPNAKVFNAKKHLRYNFIIFGGNNCYNYYIGTPIKAEEFTLGCFVSTVVLTVEINCQISDNCSAININEQRDDKTEDSDAKYWRFNCHIFGKIGRRQKYEVALTKLD